MGWNEFESFHVGRAVNHKVPVMKGKYSVDLPLLSQGHQACIGKIHGKVPIFHHQRPTARHIRESNVSDLNGPSNQEFPKRILGS
jgi:hypothetical protein